MALQFVIIQQDSLIAVGNSAVFPVSLTGLAANIGQVSYQKNEGRLQYNDRPENPVEFTDPAPYQPFINTWMTTAAAQMPALQLAQAKQTKVDLVEAIFHHKRRLPYTSGPWVYDARDDAVANMRTIVDSHAAVSASPTGLISSINAAFATLTSQVNATVVGGANAMVNANNSSAAAVNGWSAGHTSNWGGIYINNGQCFAPFGLIGSAGGPGSPGAGPGSGGFANMTYVGSIAGAVVGAGGVTSDIGYVGSISYMPLNATVAQTILSNDVQTALLGIANRRNGLNTDRLTKQNAINALTTIAQCTTYDATTGWSS